MASRNKESVGGDWMELSRDLAKAEKELRIEKWVRIVIGYRNERNECVDLYLYDLPREVYERHRWIVRWRCARLQCRFPRFAVQCYYDYYDRRTGLKTGMGSCLSALAAAKAQVTKAERNMEKYILHQKEKYPLFGYDENADPALIKYREKLAAKKLKLVVAEQTIRDAVENHKQEMCGSTPLVGKSQQAFKDSHQITIRL